MNTFTTKLALTAIMTSAVAAYKLVGFDDAAVTAVDAPVKGVSLNPGEIGSATAIHAAGPIQVEASGVVAAGDRPCVIRDRWGSNRRRRSGEFVRCRSHVRR